MKLAVIDDERPSRSELKHLVEEILPNAQVDEADSAHGAMELASRETYAAMFVDIHLGDMPGTDLCKVLQKMQPDLKIIFATAYDEYAVKAFDVNATDYILKPFDPARVRRALERVEESALQVHPTPSGQLKKLSILSDKRVVVIDIPDIAFIETDSRSCILHTRTGEYQSPQPLNYFEKKLSEDCFFRIHKSYLVNLAYITELSPWFNGMYCAKLKGYEKEIIPVSRKQVKAVKDIFEV